MVEMVKVATEMGAPRRPGRKRVFGVDDQQAFAALSGDFNPLHIDPLAARRSMVGGAVVHGVHALLWALDCWFSENGGPLGKLGLRSLDVSFIKPINVGAELLYEGVALDTETSHIRLSVAGNTVAEIDVAWRTVNKATHNPDVSHASQAPRELDAAQLTGLRGDIPLTLARAASEAMLPKLTRRFCPRQIAILLATTRLVGMECPGLHSLYSELHLTAADADCSGGDQDAMLSLPSLQYSVAKFDARFGIASIDIAMPGFLGNIRAFLRPAPQRQPACGEIAPQIESGEFAGQRALIVGGSRGLGEVFAKVLALGGADVLIGYHRGAQDAEALVTEIIAAGGRAQAIALDVQNLQDTQQSAALAMLLQQPVSHLYYMATPFIFCGQRGVFQAALFARFCDYYVNGFAELFTRLKHPGLRGVFYPSSVALDELPPDMGEYVAAKSAGETLCGVFAKANPTIQFVHPRLPRLATDQTKTLAPSKNLPPLPLSLTILRTIWKEAT